MHIEHCRGRKVKFNFESDWHQQHVSGHAPMSLKCWFKIHIHIAHCKERKLNFEFYSDWHQQEGFRSCLDVFKMPFQELKSHWALQRAEMVLTIDWRCPWPGALSLPSAPVQGHLCRGLQCSLRRAAMVLCSASASWYYDRYCHCCYCHSHHHHHHHHHQVIDSYYRSW